MGTPKGRSTAGAANPATMYNRRGLFTPPAPRRMIPRRRWSPPSTASPPRSGQRLLPISRGCPRRSLVRFLWICIAGAVGTGARYLLGDWILRLTGPSFPWSTLVINTLGSFLIGAIMQVALTVEGFNPTLRVALTTGLMGGFTTYSTFNYETLRYFEEGALWLGGLNVGGTVVSCLVAGRLGVLAGRWLVGG